MLEILKTLKETPLPIVLVIGGLIFLLIPFIQKINAKEVGIETTNQSLAGFIGIVLLVTGIALYIVPSGTLPSSLPTAIPPSGILVAETPLLSPVTQASQPTDFIPPTVPVQPTISVPHATIPIPSLCPDFVSRSVIQTWNIGEANVPIVDTKVAEFNTYRTYPRGNFIEGDKIPAGVIVATSFDGAGKPWTEFPVQPLVHRGNYGLFETLKEYIAPYEGACISIAP